MCIIETTITDMDPGTVRGVTLDSDKLTLTLAEELHAET